MTVIDLSALLYQGEGPALDFKAEQYVMTKPKAEDGAAGADITDLFRKKKSELLKDILAMANAWRDSTCHILIGVKEQKGGAAEVIGLPDDQLFDDAVFQQFVNEKLAHPLRFSYSIAEHEGKKVGVLAIPKQPGRPFYSATSFGNVAANAVYVRRGTSTAIADPTEIARMGHDEVAVQKKAELDFSLTDKTDNALGGSVQQLAIVDFGDIEALGDYTEYVGAGRSMFMSLAHVNSDYYRQMATAIDAFRRLVPIKLAIRSKSRHSLHECKLELIASDSDGKRLKVLEKADLPRIPNRISRYIVPAYNHLNFDRNSATTINAHEDGSCTFGFRNIRPGETVVPPEDFYIHVNASTEVTLTFQMFSSDLPEPMEHICVFRVNATVEDWDRATLVAYIDRRPRSDDE